MVNKLDKLYFFPILYEKRGEFDLFMRKTGNIIKSQLQQYKKNSIDQTKNKLFQPILSDFPGGYTRYWITHSHYSFYLVKGHKIEVCLRVENKGINYTRGSKIYFELKYIQKRQPSTNLIYIEEILNRWFDYIIPQTNKIEIIPYTENLAKILTNGINYVEISSESFLIKDLISKTSQLTNLIEEEIHLSYKLHPLKNCNNCSNLTSDKAKKNFSCKHKMCQMGELPYYPDIIPESAKYNLGFRVCKHEYKN